jgi:transcriptional regulator with XRE-family HTH domain
MSTFDGRQITAARALADLTITELAEVAGVSKRTVHRLEIGGEQNIAKKLRHGHVSGEVWAKIAAALKRHGVELLSETDEHGAGARWILPRDRRTAAPPARGATIATIGKASITTVSIHAPARGATPEQLHCRNARLHVSIHVNGSSIQRSLDSAIASFLA